jgi:hypothetical protein
MNLNIQILNFLIILSNFNFHFYDIYLLQNLIHHLIIQFIHHQLIKLKKHYYYNLKY